MLILLKTFLPLISSFIFGLFKASMDAKRHQNEMLIERLSAVENTRKRAMQVKDKKVAWTRRVLALLFSCSLIGVMCVIILAGIFNPDLVVNVPQQVFKHSIFSFIGLVQPRVINNYIQLEGVTLALPLLEVMIIITETIIGFYFGSKR